MIVSFFCVWGILQIPVANGFLPTSTPKFRVSGIPAGKSNRFQVSKTSRLFANLWDRMEIEEDDEPYWYLLNCVAGLEMDLLQQVRHVAESLPSEDVVKFVVPTITKTRSHGAKRMLRETKVKYQGYVFAKLRLTKETYEPINQVPLCRSWMGTINMKGYKKLPPAPLPLSEEEIENFDLENPVWETDDEVESSETDTGIIVDTFENDEKEREEEAAIEEEVKTVYNSLKVEDMIKVTAKSKFTGEDGIVKRLKEGKVLIRFFTYGQTFDEWLDPSDVRKLTDQEILKGLGGPSKPITQRDLDYQKERGERDGYGYNDARNSVGAFGGGSRRERRQDRTERNFRRDSMSEQKERENWNWYKENEKKNQGGGYDDGDGVEFRAGSESKRKKDNFWAEGDVDSQWGRSNKDRRSRTEDDWSSFVSTSASRDKRKNAPTKEETDDFFASLMTDLSKDADGSQGRDGSSADQQKSFTSGDDDDDDFFSSLMSEIEDESSTRTEQKSTSATGNKNNYDDDDFFASLEKEIRSSNKSKEKKAIVNNAITSEEDDFFASLEMELASDLEEEDKSKETKATVNNAAASKNDDFFASLEMELESDVKELKGDNLKAENSKETKVTAKNPVKSEEDFFASLEMELASDIKESKVDEPSPAIDHSGEDDFFSSLEEELRQDLDKKEIKENDTMHVRAEVEKKHSPKKEPNDVLEKASSFDAATLKKRTVPELKDILRDHGLKVSGKKAELIERITSVL